MTVPLPVFVAVWLAVALVVTYMAAAMFNARHDADIQRGINRHNNEHHARELALIVSGILDRAQLTELPKLDSKKWATLIDLYDENEMLPFPIPAQITTNDADRPVIYWKVTNVNELPAYVLARLWLAGIL